MRADRQRTDALGTGTAPTRRQSITAVGLWLVLVLVCVWVLSGVRLNTDMSAFLPSNPNEHQRLLVDQLKEGALSRMVLIGIEGGDAAGRAATSERLAAALRANPGLTSVVNGDATSRERDQTRIGDDVEIGANTCVDRGALDDTVIEDGVKLDNLIQIGHNTHIGKHTAMAGCVGVAGSARIGAYCTVGGAGMISGHISIADHVHVTAGTLVSRSLTKPGHYTGFFPVDENSEWEKNAATLRQLYRLRDRIKQLERRLAESEEQ